MSHWLAVSLVAVVVLGVGGAFAVSSQRQARTLEPRAAPTPFVLDTPSPSPTPTAVVPKFTRPGEDAPVYLIGDSWSVGYSANKGRGYVDLLADATGGTSPPMPRAEPAIAP